MANTNAFTDGQTLLIQIIDVVDSQGQPATFTAPPVWTSSDPTILAPTVASDGLSAQGILLKTGSVTITVVGDGVTQSVTITGGAGAVASFALQVTVVPPPSQPSA